MIGILSFNRKKTGEKVFLPINLEDGIIPSPTTRSRALSRATWLWDFSSRGGRNDPKGEKAGNHRRIQDTSCRYRIAGSTGGHTDRKDSRVDGASKGSQKGLPLAARSSQDGRQKAPAAAVSAGERLQQVQYADTASRASPLSAG